MAAKRYITTLRQKVETLAQTYQAPPEKRERRAVSLIGQLERDWFGVATLDDIATVKLAINSLLDSQSEMLISAKHTTAVLKLHTNQIRSVSLAITQLKGMLVEVAKDMLAGVSTMSTITRVLSHSLYAHGAGNIYTRGSFIMQMVETSLNIAAQALSDGMSGRLTPDIISPAQLSDILSKFKAAAFKETDMYLWNLDGRDNYIEFYRNCRVTLSQTKAGTAMINVYVPITSERDLYKHLNIVAAPYRSNSQGRNAYRVATRGNATTVDILISTEGIFWANPNRFSENKPGRISSYSTTKLTKVHGRELQCLKAIIYDENDSILEQCSPDTVNVELEVIKISDQQIIVYSADPIKIKIECPINVVTQRYDANFSAKDLIKLKMPKTCNAHINDTEYIGLPATVASAIVHRDNFEYTVQPFRSFEPSLWIKVLSNGSAASAALKVKLLEDIQALNLTDLLNTNKSVILMGRIMTSLRTAEAGNKYSRYLTELIGNPYAISISTIAFIVAAILIALGCIINKMRVRTAPQIMYKSLESYELKDVEQAMQLWNEETWAKSQTAQ